jgi:hypothetical protein
MQVIQRGESSKGTPSVNMVDMHPKGFDPSQLDRLQRILQSKELR